jgi:formate hydrogenlyase subunit 6/NADH:ubiquinone oxidoreductase subunit I
LVKNLLLEHPKFDKDKCIKCGECAKICPPHALTMIKKELPKLKSSNCIRCWCCAEVCPQNAIERTNRPILGKILLKTDKNK